MAAVAVNDASSILFTGGTGAGPTYDLRKPCRSFGFMKTVSGPFSALTVNYEGSLDGTTWFQIGTDATTAAGYTPVVDKPCRYVRANVTVFTGGTTVAVTMLPQV